MRRTALVFAAVAITLYMAPLRGAGNVDAAFDAFWKAPDPKVAEKAIGGIVASGIDFDTAVRRLKAGRTYAKEKTGIIRIPQKVGGEDFERLSRSRLSTTPRRSGRCACSSTAA